MQIIKYIICVVAILAHCLMVSGREQHAELSVAFRVKATVIDCDYQNNGRRLDEIIDTLSRLQNNPRITIHNITFGGTSSPDGSSELNRRLARTRMTSLEKAVRRKVDIPEELIQRDSNYISWKRLAEMVRLSEIVHRDSVLAIIGRDESYIPYRGRTDRSIDSRVVALSQIDGGKVWKKLAQDHFDDLRNAGIIVISYTFNQPYDKPIAASEFVPEKFESPDFIRSEFAAIQSAYSAVPHVGLPDAKMRHAENPPPLKFLAQTSHIS